MWPTFRLIMKNTDTGAIMTKNTQKKCCGIGPIKVLDKPIIT